jgi:transcription-repair coupling factor (superfamily II helicase)
MSIIETPPKDRLSIQTNVVKFDAPIIERAIRNELARNGQVYFVHNRVESIYSIGHLLQRLVPEARVVVGHGQMGEDELERAMLGFVDKQFDVLLATTIVENGLDIPNANTIIINRADRYGLSQLYQLRGRVGRSDRPAYAYLLIPPQDALSPVARKRLAGDPRIQRLGQRIQGRRARSGNPGRRQPARRRAERAHRCRRLRDVHEAARRKPSAS